MDEIFSDFNFVKVKNSLKNVIEKLEKNNYILDKNYYILDIYMIKKGSLNIDKDYFSLKELPDYLILRDYNNEKKELILFNDGMVRGKVKGIFTTKYIVEQLGYERMFNMNEDVYFYVKNTTGNIITIIDIRDNGVYIDKSSIDNIELNKEFDYLNQNDKDFVNNKFLEYLKSMK